MQPVSRSVRSPALAGLVDTLWWAPADPEAKPASERILPTGRAQIIISARCNESVFVGPKAVSEDIVRQGDRSMVGVSLHAGAAPAFVGASSDEMLDRTIDLDAVWTLRCLIDELAELDSEAALARFEDALVARVRPDFVDGRVMRAERAIRSGVSAGRVARSLGEDRRTLVPDFRRAVGVGPKHYERIRRFGRCIEQMRQVRPQPLAALAAELGYSDQAHLTREVKTFSGMNPIALLGDGTATPNHVALPTRSSRPGTS